MSGVVENSVPALSRITPQTGEPDAIPQHAPRPTCSLVVIESHPVQYHAPVYRALQRQYGIAVTVIYGSDFSVAGYRDREFGASFAWDVDLLSGYQSVFLSRATDGCSRSVTQVSARGLGRALGAAGRGPVLLVGYSGFHRMAFIQAWRSGRPLLLRAETADHAVTRNAVKTAVRDQILRRVYAACSALLYIGRRSEQHFQRLGVPDTKLRFSPYCVDTAPFQVDETSRSLLRHAARRHLNVGRDQLVLLFAGKLSRRKGADLLVAAVKALPSAIRDRVVVAFLGSGELRQELAARAACSPAIRVHFCGFKNQTELSPYYHAADLLALPSRHSETWGLVVNEALSHGVPCVVSDAVGCAPDLIEPGMTGEIAAADSVVDLGSAIVRAQSLAGRPDVRRRCRDRVSGYTVDRAAQGIAAAYQAVVA